MTYTLACKDLGMQCDHIVRGSSVAEVKVGAMAHAQEIHLDVLKTMSKEQMAGMDKMIESVIKPA